MASTPSSSSSCSDDVAPSKQCLICGCESTGKHYGCQSCSSCKAFFRRAVLDNIDARCKRTPTCLKNAPINHICRSCRFQRCLDKGMKKSGLHAARDSIGKRSPKAQATTDVVRVGSISPCEPLNSTFNMLQLLAELTYNDKTLRKRKAENLRPKGIQYAKTSSTKLADGDDVREVTETELVNLVEWANTLPLFEHLSHEDRQMLLKKSAVYHLILEHCYYTAQTEQNDLLFYANGSFVPRATKVLPEDSKRDISKERSWRLDCLYGKSTGQCLDHVAAPLRRLKLLPEELVVLKILMLLSCGEVMGTANVGADLTSADDRIKLLECRNRIVAALFHFYESMNVKNSAERFGNVLLSISGIVACSPVALESYQMARLLKYVVFDETAEQLLFNNS